MSDAPTSSTCVLLTRAHGGELAGTAPVARGWVLVEQPGSWGRQALTASGLPAELGASLSERAGDDVRVQLVRRPGRGSEDAFDRTSRTVILAHAGDEPWAERLEVDDATLASLDPSIAAAPSPPGLGEPVDGPLWLVCTHGKRDRCCATYGRPIADALAALHRDAVWEVSHLGGHRFAGNLLCLPDGAVYGALQVSQALQVLDLHRTGRVALEHLRGRSGLDRAAQAAEIHTRRELGLDRRHAVVAGAAGATAADGSVAVHLAVGASRYVATVRLEPTGVTYPQSCDSAEAVDPGRWTLLELVPT